MRRLRLNSGRRGRIRTCNRRIRRQPDLIEHPGMSVADFEKAILERNPKTSYRLRDGVPTPAGTFLVRDHLDLISEMKPHDGTPFLRRRAGETKAQLTS